MSDTTPEQSRIIERLPIGDDLRLSADRWHEQRQVSSPVDASWLELVCAYGDDPGGRALRIRLAVSPTPAGVGDLIELHDTERLATVLPVPPDLFEQPATERDDHEAAIDPGIAAPDDGPLIHLQLAHRVAGGSRGWIAHCDRPAQNHYEALLGELEAIYPDDGDPKDMARIARAALSQLDGLPELAARHGSSLEPESTGGAIWRVRGAQRLVVLPLLVALQWALGTRDRGLIDEFDSAVSERQELTAWRAAAAKVAGLIETGQRILDAIRSEPGVKQAELADRLTLEKGLVREIMSVMDWANVVRREKDGASYRLYLN